MSKLFIRLMVVFVALYMVTCYLVAAIFEVNIWCQFYYPMLWMVVCLCISKQGLYHCRYIKWTAYGLFVEELAASLDAMFDIIPDNVFAVMPPMAIMIGLTVTTTLAVQHYIKVKRIKKIWRVNHPS